MKHAEANGYQEISVGPVKIKDGLFMGDELAAKDIEFIISNKVTHVINTVAHKIPNLWENFCVHYLSVGWTEKQTNIFDKKNNGVNAIYTFIQEANERGESCLVHSVHGKSRACTIIVAYLMKKYKWSLGKCLQFVDSRKEFLQIRINFLSELQALQSRIKKQHPLNDKWDVSKSDEEKIVNNTFRNSLSTQDSQKVKKQKPRISHGRRIQWNQQSSKTIEFSQNQSVLPIPKSTKKYVKPILKTGEMKEDYEFYKHPVVRKKISITQSDSLDHILFQSSKKKKKVEENPIPTKVRRKKTREICSGSLEKMQLQKNQQNLTLKKIQHYNQVLASYHTITKGTETPATQLLNSIQSFSSMDRNQMTYLYEKNESVDRCSVESRSNSENKKILRKKKDRKRRKTNSSHSPQAVKGRKGRRYHSKSIKQLSEFLLY